MRGKMAWWVGAVVVGTLLVILGSTFLSGAKSEGNPGVGTDEGDIAPDFRLLSREGPAISLSDFRGKTVILNFWASWCVPCKEEMPYLEAIHRERGGQGVVVLGVNIEEEKGTVDQFMQEMGLTFPVVLDSNGSVTNRYFVRYIPTTFILDKDGVIRLKKVGPFQSTEEIAAVLENIQ